MKKYIPSVYKQILIYSFLGVWLWSAVNPKHPADWELENYLIIISIPVILLIGKYFNLSNISYTVITIFMVLHILGAHYTYPETPLGFEIQKMFGANRNLYDRLLHFLFGFLFSYPLVELYLQITKRKYLKGIFIPLAVIISLSALYEVYEILLVQSVDQFTAIAFIGNQGDLWDSQYDILTAAVGGFFGLKIISQFKKKNKKTDSK